LIVDSGTEPEVSVVIVAYRSGADLADCLRSLASTEEPTRFEVIVVDNACPDRSGISAAAAFPWVRLIEATENLGFAVGCELGVLHSRAAMVCFLNPDVVVRDGWLAPLVRAIEIGPGAAAASVTLSPTGEVLEAGSGLYVESSGASFTEALPTVGRRTVDYASACCVLISKAMHLAVGGFSAAYWPAYYEDVEWGIALAKFGGLQVVPASVVMHRMAGVEREILAARETFIVRNRRALDMAPTAVLHGGSGEQIFVIEDRIPHVDAGSGDPRAALLASTLASVRPSAEIVWFARDGRNADRYRSTLDEVGIVVVAGDVEQELQRRCGEAGVIIAARPNNHADLRDTFDRFQPQALRIYDAESLFHKRIALQAEISGDEALWDAARAAREDEEAAIAWADGVLAVTTDVAEFAREVNEAAVIRVASFAVPMAAATPSWNERDGVVVFGGFMAGPGSPNEDAAVVAAREIQPRLGAPITIAGALPTDVVRALASDVVSVEADVADPVRFLSGFRVNLCPLRFGAGLKLRIFDAASAGTPTVMTPCGAEGMGLSDDLADLLVAGSPAEMCEKARRLLDDPAAWDGAIRGLRALIERDFSRTTFERAVSELLRELGA